MPEAAGMVLCQTCGSTEPGISEQPAEGSPCCFSTTPLPINKPLMCQARQPTVVEAACAHPNCLLHAGFVVQAAMQMRFQADVVCQRADVPHRLIHPSTWLRHLVRFVMSSMFSEWAFQRFFGACDRVRTKLCKHFTKGYCRYEDLGETCTMKTVKGFIAVSLNFCQGNCTFAHQLDELVYRPDLTQLVFQSTLAEFSNMHLWTWGVFRKENKVDRSSVCTVLSWICSLMRRACCAIWRCARFLSGACNVKNCSFAHSVAELRHVDPARMATTEQERSCSVMHSADSAEIGNVEPYR